MLIIGRPSYSMEFPAAMAQRLAFSQAGRKATGRHRLDQPGVDGNTTEPTTLVDGRPLRLAAGTSAPRNPSWPCNLDDDDHLVLFAYHEFSEFSAHVGDFLSCPVPKGTCRILVRASESPYVPPGDVP